MKSLDERTAIIAKRVHNRRLGIISTRMGTDPYCNGIVFMNSAGKSAMATCHRCGLRASRWWWEEIGLKGLG